MKITSLLKIALVTGSLVLVSNSGAMAQDTSTASSDSGHHHDSVLTADERAELKADRDKVFAANPDLKSQADDLKSQRSSMSDATPEDKAAFRDKWHTLMDKVNTEVEKIDPNAAALIEKMKAAHHAKADSTNS
jgi:hypothetical protein